MEFQALDPRLGNLLLDIEIGHCKRRLGAEWDALISGYTKQAVTMRTKDGVRPHKILQTLIPVYLEDLAVFIREAVAKQGDAVRAELVEMLRGKKIEFTDTLVDDLTSVIWHHLPLTLYEKIVTKENLRQHFDMALSGIGGRPSEADWETIDRVLNLRLAQLGGGRKAAIREAVRWVQRHVKNFLLEPTDAPKDAVLNLLYEMRGLLKNQAQDQEPSVDVPETDFRKLKKQLEQIASQVVQGNTPEKQREAIAVILEEAERRNSSFDTGAIPGTWNQFMDFCARLVGDFFPENPRSFANMVKGEVRKYTADALCKLTGRGDNPWPQLFPEAYAPQ